MSRPLEGVLVVDLTRVLSGPYCTMMLADLGARVIKVEPPAGDDSRQFPPFGDQGSTYFAAFNRGKESIALDLTDAEGRRVFEALLDRADVLVENFRPGVLAKLGYDPQTLAARWPGLVRASISGFGQTGPDRLRMAYDLLIQAMGGVMGLTGPEGGAPTRVGTSLVDIGSGMFAATGIVAALYERRSTGRGRAVDVAMLDSQVAMLEHALMRSQLGDPPQRLGARFPTVAPADVFRTADGEIVLACPTQKQFVAAMQALGLGALAEDPRFAARDTRLANQAVLKGLIEGALAAQTTAHWDAVLVAAGVPCGPVRRMEELLADPQLAARGMLRDQGGVRVAGNPIKLEGMAEPSTVAPGLDADRARLLAEFLGD